MDFNAVVARLAETGDQRPTDQELSEALAAVALAAAPLQGQPASAENVAALSNLQNAARQLSGERANRATLAAQQTAALAELGQLTEQPAPPAAPESPAADPPAEGTPAADPPAEPAPDAPPADGEPNGTGEQAVTAGAGRPLGGTPFSLGGGAPTTLPTYVRPKTTPARIAALPASNATDAEVSTREGLATVFANKRRDLGGTGGGDGKITLASITWDFPEERFLRAGASPFANLVKVEAVTDAAAALRATDNALVAAGLCAPLEVLWDVPVVGDTDRPVRDALARFGADRGGIQYRAAVEGVTQTGGIGTWTKTDDVADPLVNKTCFTVTCPGILTAEVEALYACLEFSNMSTRFDPELMDAQIRAQMIAHARIAENKLLTILTTGSKPLYTTKLLGAVRDILVTLDKVTAYYRNVHRLADQTSLRAILPAWARNLMRADVTRQMVGDGLQSLEVTDQVIDGWFRARNVNITWHLDGINPADLTVPTPDVVTANQLYTIAAAEAAVPGFPDTVTMNLFKEGDWLYLDGGQLDLGVVRDSVTNARNRFQTFSEEFSTATHRGIESLVIHMAVQPTGESAATASTSAAVD